MKTAMKSKKGTVPAGFANGGVVKESKAEEAGEKRLSRKAYFANERKEGEKVGGKGGKLKMANGGTVAKKGKC